MVSELSKHKRTNTVKVPPYEISRLDKFIDRGMSEDSRGWGRRKMGVIDYWSRVTNFF